MKRDDRMRLVIQARETREQEAAGAVAEARRQLQQQRRYLDELVAWQAEYQKQASGHEDRAAMSVSQFTQRRRFQSGLESAIQQQRDVIRRSEQRLAAMVDRWREAALHTRAAQQLQEKIDTEARREMDRIEQEEMDDVTLRGKTLGGDFNVSG